MNLAEYSKELADRYADACNCGDLSMVTLLERNIIPHFMELHGYKLNFDTVEWDFIKDTSMNPIGGEGILGTLSPD